MKKVWHKSLNFYLPLYKQDTEEGDRLRWQRAECRLPHLCLCSLSGVSPLEPTEAKGNLLITFKAFTWLQSGYLKSGIQIHLQRTTGTYLLLTLHSDLGPSMPKFLEKRDGHNALCLGNGFSSSSEEQLQPSVFWVAHEGWYGFEQMLRKTLIFFPNC